MDTGGKGLYLGGLQQFEEYALEYHNITPSTDAELETKMASENHQTFQQKQLALERMVSEPPLKLCITNSNGPLAYHLAQHVATTGVSGISKKVAIHLYHEESNSLCKGLALELKDLASSCLEYVRFTTSLHEAFEGVSLVYILNYPYTAQNLDKYTSQRKRNEEISTVTTLFQTYAIALESAANSDVKVVINGCFANTGAAIMAASVSSLPSGSFVAAPCLAESQAKAIIAKRLKLNSSNITQVAIWGRTHGTVLADISFTRVSKFPGAIVGPEPFNLPLTRCEFDTNWLEQEFPELLMSQHSHLRGYKKEGAVLVEAVGLAQLGNCWLLGDSDKDWQSVGVVSDGGIYDVPKGVVCSVPCQCKEGKWQLIPHLVLSDNIKVSNNGECIKLGRIIIVIQEQLVSQVHRLKKELDLALVPLDIKK